MASTDIWVAVVNENGTYSLLGRVCADDSTGAASPEPTEGNLTKQADLTSITLYIKDATTNVEVTGSPITLTISSVLNDTLQTSGIWGLITGGGNFKYRVGASMTPDGERTYRAEAKFIPTGGAESQWWGKWHLDARAILSA